MHGGFRKFAYSAFALVGSSWAFNSAVISGVMRAVANARTDRIDLEDLSERAGGPAF
jgi:hypothetical protein